MVRRLLGALAVLAVLLSASVDFFPTAAAPLPPPTPAKTVGYGVWTLAAPDRLDRAKSIGFNWVKLIGSWKSVQPDPSKPPDWRALDADIERATTRGMRILLRIDEPPAWATGTEARNAPPTDDSTLATFLGLVAARYRGKVQAYEIWNEQNTSLEWGGRTPDPAKYARMLRALHPKVKAADPNAIVVTGGLATTGDAGAGGDAWGDLVYLRALYENGAKGFFDAIGSHPYAGPYAPETSGGAAPLGVYFRRAEDHRKVAEQFGDDVAVWITEFGWLHNFESAQCNLASYDPYRAPWQIAEETQADYLVRAYTYARQNWPWAGPLFIYNLDFSIDTWRVRCDPNRLFSLVKGDGSPLLAMKLLSAMPRWESDLPSAAVKTILPVIADSWFTLAWTSNDATSGVASIDVQYRTLPNGAWKPLSANVGDNLLDIDLTDRTTYQFRIQPMDWAGNRGAWVESNATIASLGGLVTPTVSSVSLWLTPTNAYSGSAVLQNLGGGVVNWTAASDQAWLSLSPRSGHLGPGQRAVLTLTVAGTLGFGQHRATINLGGDGWRVGGPLVVEVQVMRAVERRYIPLINMSSSAPVSLSGATERRRVRAAGP
ncbi:MAG: cellulase family glycosylhydrolase [Dehalococcoidia bacterium]